MDRKPIFVLTTLVIAIFVIAIIVMAALYATSGGPAPFDFGIVMDGGSSKTNVLLYKWAGDKYKGTGCVRQEGGCLVKGGIAKSNVSYVLPCLDEVKKNVTAESLNSTPLYFASTAGMRLLNMSDPALAKGQLDSLTALLNNTGVDLKTVEIITGKDEGQYAWISANFLKDTLETKQKLNPWQPTTVGALDMGGASTQIAFALEPTKDETGSGVEKVELYGQTHHVFSASYLCFGRGEAETRHRALLVKDPKDIASVTDPCLPKGLVTKMTGSELFDQPCTQSDKFRNWLKGDPTLKTKEVTFVGSSDFDGCTKAMARLADSTTCEEQNFNECFQKINKPLQNQKFLAFATFVYTTSALEVIGKPLEEFTNATKNYCTKTWDDMNKNDPHAPSYCFNACYIYEILINGYNFTNTTWPNIEFVEKIDDKEIGWTLGYMIKATNLIPAKNPKPKFTSLGVFAVCMIIFTSIVIAAAVFLAYNFGRKSSRQMDLPRNF